MSNIVSITPACNMGSATIVEVNGREIPNVLDVECYESAEGIRVTLVFMAAQANYIGQNAFRDPEIVGLIPTEVTPGHPPQRNPPPSRWRRFKAWCRRMAAAYERWENDY